jgi:hypothetical protein
VFRKARADYGKRTCGITEICKPSFQIDFEYPKRLADRNGLTLIAFSAKSWGK